MKLTAAELLEMGIVDKVIPERGRLTGEIVSQLKGELVAELAHLASLPLDQLLQERYERFRKY